jgi:hypothetical protein
VSHSQPKAPVLAVAMAPAKISQMVAALKASESLVRASEGLGPQTKPGSSKDTALVMAEKRPGSKAPAPPAKRTKGKQTPRAPLPPKAAPTASLAVVPAAPTTAIVPAAPTTAMVPAAPTKAKVALTVPGAAPSSKRTLAQDMALLEAELGLGKKAAIKNLSPLFDEEAQKAAAEAAREARAAEARAQQEAASQASFLEATQAEASQKPEVLFVAEDEEGEVPEPAPEEPDGELTGEEEEEDEGPPEVEYDDAQERDAFEHTNTMVAAPSPPRTLV